MHFVCSYFGLINDLVRSYKIKQSDSLTTALLYNNNNNNNKKKKLRKSLQSNNFKKYKVKKKYFHRIIKEMSFLRSTLVLLGLTPPSSAQFNVIGALKKRIESSHSRLGRNGANKRKCSPTKGQGQIVVCRPTSLFTTTLISLLAFHCVPPFIGQTEKSLAADAAVIGVDCLSSSYDCFFWDKQMISSPKIASRSGQQMIFSQARLSH